MIYIYIYIYMIYIYICIYVCMYRYMHTYIHMNRKQAGHQGQMRRRLRSARGRRQPRARAALSSTFLPVRPQRRSPARPRKAAVSSGRGRLTVAGSSGRGRRGGAGECPTWSKPVAPLRASCRNDRMVFVAIKLKEEGVCVCGGGITPSRGLHCGMR